MLYFPHPLQCDEEGLLAVGGDLSPERLRLAYSFGIFPWYNQDPILWWFTHPRCVIYPKETKVSKSMRSLITNKRPWQVTINENFSLVIDLCGQTVRPDQQGTWITDTMKQAYITLHQEGLAHSVEVWEEGKIIGGLYGVLVGKIFFGESMFSTKSNSSKYAFIHLSKYLENLGCTIIDCQQDTAHMRSMGATTISKESFWEIVKTNTLSTHLQFTKESFDNWQQSTFQ